MGFLTMFSWVSMWSVFGLISIITTIWFAGPLIAIAENKPLESVLARVIAIVVVSLIFLGVYLYKLYKSRFSLYFLVVSKKRFTFVKS